MRFSLSGFVVAVLFAVCAESASAEEKATYRAEVLRYLFECDPGSLHHQLQDHFGASNRDDEWSPRAEIRLSDWFTPEGNASKVDVTCGADICTVDFLMSFHEFATEHRSVVERWKESGPPGFLPEGLHFPRYNGSTRLFVFRDSFDPDSL